MAVLGLRGASRLAQSRRLNTCARLSASRQIARGYTRCSSKEVGALASRGSESRVMVTVDLDGGGGAVCPDVCPPWTLYEIFMSAGGSSSLEGAVGYHGRHLPA